MTLMGTDVERIVSGLRDIHEIWASTISIGFPLAALCQTQFTRRSVVAQLVVFRQRPQSKPPNGHVL